MSLHKSQRMLGPCVGFPCMYHFASSLWLLLLYDTLQCSEDSVDYGAHYGTLPFSFFLLLTLLRGSFWFTAKMAISKLLPAEKHILTAHPASSVIRPSALLCYNWARESPALSFADNNQRSISSSFPHFPSSPAKYSELIKVVYLSVKIVP